MIIVQTSASVVAHNQPDIQDSGVLSISKLYFLLLALAPSLI